MGIFHPKTLLFNIRDFFRLPGSILASIKVLRKFNPDVVFSKGGFVAVPVGIAARWLHVPIVTHDSDTIAGLANRIIGRWAVAHATGMPAENYAYPKTKTHFIGIPLDERIVKVTPKIQNQAKRKLKLPEDSTVLLMSGGGNGSKHLNDLLVSIARELLESNLALYIVHISGQSHEQKTKQAYKELPLNDQKRIFVFGYTNDFYSYCATADLIITRAGATTLAELAAAGKASIVIASPFLAGGHQLKNAKWLAEQDAIVTLPETASADELHGLINSLLADDRRRFELSRNFYAAAKPNASASLAQLILKIARQAKN